MRAYPFRRWKEDVRLWHLGTELSEELVGPAIARRLGGQCGELIRTLNGDMLRDGNTNVTTGVHESGMSLLMQALQDRYDKFPVETSTSAIIEMLRFHRNPVASIDDTLSRYENIRAKVKSLAAGFDLPHAAASWLLFEALRIPKQHWPLLLPPFGGTFPLTRRPCEP